MSHTLSEGCQQDAHLQLITYIWFSRDSDNDGTQKRDSEKGEDPFLHTLWSHRPLPSIDTDPLPFGTHNLRMTAIYVFTQAALYGAPGTPPAQNVMPEYIGSDRRHKDPRPASAAYMQTTNRVAI